MNLQTALLGMLLIAVVLASVRLCWWQWRAPQRACGWRLALLLLAQPLCAALLYFTLLPPPIPGQAGTMVVLTAGATFAPATAFASGDSLVALPEAVAPGDAERVPDLATALRRHPGTRRLHVVGAGLPARDRDVAHGLALNFDAAPLPRGLVRLDPPERIAAGTAFPVGGRINGVAEGSVELLDPAGQRVDAAVLAKEGEFVLSGTARTPGLATFQLRIHDPQRKLLEQVDVPLWIAADPAPRVLILAGAPNPELKYLRRWIADAGMQAHTQISVGGGLQLGDAPLPLNAANLERFDLLVMDDRAWVALGETQRVALEQALRGGLGVLLRITGPVPEATRRQLRRLGFVVSGGNDSAEVRLSEAARDEDRLRARRGAGSKDAPVDSAATTVPTLNRRGLRIEANDAVAGLRDASGASLADWRAEGRGRVGLWSLTDSYRLVLEGRDDVYGELWSDAFATLARARAGTAPQIEREAYVQRRMRLCGITEDARVIAPDGTATSLLPDPATGTPECAAYWPTSSGWHLLVQGDERRPFPVRDGDEVPGMRAAGMREATLSMVGGGNPFDVEVKNATPLRRGSSWPWFFAWLLVSAGLWWFERSRLGLPLQRPAT